MEPEVLGERYELAEPIGRGGMATIFRADDLRMGRTVAVKVLRDVYSTDPKFVTRFQREARAASALQHPNIVQVFDYGQSGESYYIVMEFVEGMDLRRYLKKQGILENERAIEIAHDVALGLGAAHKRGIVHRDVKPQNVMLNDEGLVKLTDFGIASMYKDAESERLTTTGMTLGTVQYYAPEQAQGEIVSPAADIYALGIVMYEMLAGRTPFDGDTPVAVAMHHIQDPPDPPSIYNNRITPALERIILKCLEKDPRNRYRDGDALAYALENLGRGGARRASNPALAGGRTPFDPLGLPANAPRGGTGVASAYGNGARRTRIASDPVPAAGYDGYGPPPPQPMYDPYDAGMEPTVSTRPYGPAGGTMPRTQTAGRISGPYGTPDGADGRRNGGVTAVVVGAAVLLLMLACVLVAVITGLPTKISQAFAGPTPMPTVTLVKVPNFVGQQYDAAVALAQAHGLTVNETMQASNTVPTGQVISQTPQSGQSAQPGSAVTLIVSSGKNKVPVPDVIGKPLNYALDKVSAANLQVKTVGMQDPTVTPGYVIRTDPPAGQQVDPSTVVTIYFSESAPTPTPTATASPTPTATATPTPTGTVAPSPVPTKVP